MNYEEISKETVSHLYKGYASLLQSPLSQELKALLELRVSFMNGCGYCIKLHTKEARQLRISQEKIDALSTWQISAHFTNEEKAALQWAEAVTRLERDLDAKKEPLSLFFSERQIVDMTICISLMNMFNRLAISLKKE